MRDSVSRRIYLRAKANMNDKVTGLEGTKVAWYMLGLCRGLEKYDEIEDQRLKVIFETDQLIRGPHWRKWGRAEQ